MAAPSLADVVAWCDEVTQGPGFPDFPGASNGLQFENDGRVTRLGAAVDANFATFEAASRAGVDFVIVHHGMMWNRPAAYTGALHRKLAHLFAHNLAVYSSHLPLDAHPTLGNNALLARRLGLERLGPFLAHEGRDIGLLARGQPRAELRARLDDAFPAGYRAIEAGPDHPARIAVCSGGGGHGLGLLAAAGADTYITGELSQSAFSEAVDRGLNLYLCGHYATETWGVRALAAAAAERFGLPWEFLDTGCPL